MTHRMAGFGFGPVQAGLFAAEARQSGNFADITVAEVDPALVAAIRNGGNRCAVNVARRDGIDVVEVEGVAPVNLADPGELPCFAAALRDATEIVSALPSVACYEAGGDRSPAALIAGALAAGGADATVVYTAENNNYAAETLAEQVLRRTSTPAALRPHRFLNTVIGKMSRVITDPAEIARLGLAPMTPGFGRAFLVEEFNHIIATAAALEGFSPGIAVFEEREDLLPFAEAKLYGHNAVHALLGFAGRAAGITAMADLRGKPAIMTAARTAFVDEIGAALVARHGHTGDPLFTPAGFRDYADDLLARMTNPWLHDTVARTIRDPVRKLGYDDRLFGAMRVCLEHGVEPATLAAGARAGIAELRVRRAAYGVPDCSLDEIFAWLWGGRAPADTDRRIMDLVRAAALPGDDR